MPGQTEDLDQLIDHQTSQLLEGAYNLFLLNRLKSQDSDHPNGQAYTPECRPLTKDHSNSGLSLYPSGKINGDFTMVINRFEAEPKKNDPKVANS